MFKKLLNKIPTPSGAIQIGQKAPDFTLPNQDGQPLSLYETLEQGPVMLVFYPGDFTSVCTAQLCSYRDQYAEFRDFGLELLGISDDPVDKHKDFQTQKKFPFPLLADPEHVVIDQFSGSSKLTLGHANRSNYIIAQDGTVLYAHIEPIAVMHRDTTELLTTLKTLKDDGKI